MQAVKVEHKVRGVICATGKAAKTAEGFNNPKAPHNQEFRNPAPDQTKKHKKYGRTAVAV